ncbi:MAG: DoxX family membrane protein [Acidobacteriota bacterium]
MNFEEIAKNLPALFGALLLSVLFIQSGLDKVFDWQGNLSYLTEHFQKTFMAPLVPVLTATITFLELAAGIVLAAGIIYFFVSGKTTVIFAGAAIAAAAIVALFAGQRIAKDYPGAAILVPYLILVLAVLWLSDPWLLR